MQNKSCEAVLKVLCFDPRRSIAMAMGPKQVLERPAGISVGMVHSDEHAPISRDMFETFHVDGGFG
jgi:hypothetical protein